METIKYKDVVGYEGKYMVSSIGEIISIVRQTEAKGKGKRILNKTVLKLRLNRCGYYYVNLYKNHKRKTFTVHRLVATAFIANPENKSQINHIDGNKQNNCINNLEWCNQSENEQHKRNVLNKAVRAVKCLEENKIFNSIANASREMKIPASNIIFACQGKYKQAGGYHWEYVS